MLVDVRGLSVTLPNGQPLLEDSALALPAGQVLALLGPSGSGKSTLLRAIFDPDALVSKKYHVSWEQRDVASAPAMVPQRGALFDHLDVSGNIQLAQRGNPGAPSMSAKDWLSAVELEPSIAEEGRSVSTLSGGQAQRVAVARTLAAGKKIVILDEPSVGLDALGVRNLAKLIVEQARTHDLAVIIITHDLALAAGAADQVLYLDPTVRTVRTLTPSWPGPAELRSDDEREHQVLSLERAMTRALLEARNAPTEIVRAPKRRFALQLHSPSAFNVLGASIIKFFEPRLFRAALTVMGRASRQSLFKPLPFYAVVGVLLGFTVLYVIAKMSADVRVEAVLRLVGGTYILSLAPPLSAILFAATSGNAVNAWLGGMQLNRQVEALEGLGIDQTRYFWAPAWMALVLAYLTTVVTFVAAMMLGGWLLFQSYDVPNGLTILSSDFLDPAPERRPYLMRAGWLLVSYALAIASIVVSRAMAAKDEASQVTSAMTGAVIRATLFVVGMELISVMVLFWTVGK